MQRVQLHPWTGVPGWVVVVYGASLVVPLFLDIGPGGVTLGRGIFDQRSSATTQTLPIGVFSSVLLVCWTALAHLITGRGIVVRLPRAVLYIIYAYFCWLGVLVVASVSESLNSVLYAIQIAIPFVSFFAAADLVTTPRRLKQWMYGIALGLTVTVVSHWISFIVDNGGIVFSTRVSTTIFGLNVYQAYNYYPLVLAISLLMVYGTFSRAGGVRHGRYVPLVALPTVLLIVMLAVRAPFGLVVLGGGTIFLFRLRRSYQRIVYGIVVFLAMTAAGYGVLKGNLSQANSEVVLLERLERATNTGDAGAASGYRIPILVEALEVFTARWYTPVVGTRLLPPNEAVPEVHFGWRSAHNYYADLILMSGLPGFALIISVLVMTLRRAWLLSRRHPDALVRAWALTAFVTLGLVCLVSNNLRVPLRQPYPGAIFWSLCAVVLALSHSLLSSNRHVSHERPDLAIESP